MLVRVKNSVGKGQTLCFGLFAVVIGLALMPHLVLVIVSFSADWYDSILPQNWTFQNYELALGSSLTVPSIRNSLFYSVMATLFNVSLGIGVAFVLVRTKVWRPIFCWTLAVMLPLGSSWNRDCLWLPCDDAKRTIF